jgi:uncharacterized RDD family membrane protein YckC
MEDKFNQVLAVKYVGFWPRFGAYIIDSIWQGILILILIQLGLPDGSQLGFFLQALILFVLILGFWFYFQSSPGKMVFSAKIVDARTGQKPTKKQLVIRSVAYIISMIPFGLGFVWIAFDSRKQGWHDKIARTVVVESNEANL